MAGVDVGGGKKGGRKTLDSEINMIPMIDLLMVTISFLLITAVWVNTSRLESSANVPGPTDAPPCTQAGCIEAKLHVETRDPSKFTLAWKEGANVVRSIDVPREGARASAAGLAYPNLASRISEEFKSSGKHRDATDLKFDHAVVHAANDMPYKELIAVMDAVAQPKRNVRTGGKTSQANAFEITFATD